jgi:NAD-dependent dihydropyrimidine dehydrogenase PreA subunit
MSSLRVIVFEGSGAEPLEPRQRASLVRALLGKGCAVSCTANGGSLAGAGGGPLLVLGRFLEPKPAETTDLAGQVPVFFRQVDASEPAAIADVVDAIRARLSLPAPGAWKPWFPVIDFTRCTNCMQCLSFCLFDVYSVSKEGKITVQNQTNCKTDCPACSRVCPEVAIMFPKYRHGPIHGGEVNADDVRREVMKVDISALLGGDIYQALRDRSALLKLTKDLDIPAEVLASLPSEEEIRARAEAARARALQAQGGTN